MTDAPLPPPPPASALPPPPGSAAPAYLPGGPPRPDTDLLGSRVLQYLIDWAITLVASLPGLLVLAVAAVRGSLALAIVAVGLVLGLSYGVSCWIEVGRAHRHGGQTYGMSALEIMVVDQATLAPPTRRQLLIRWILLLLVDGGLLAVLLIAITDQHQRVGDMAAKTLVVRADDPLVAWARAGGRTQPR